MTRNALLIGGLSRLLAGHFSLRLSTRVFLWIARHNPARERDTVVQRDFEGLDSMIDRIGRRHTAEGGTPPTSLCELSELSSIQRNPPSRDPDVQFQALAAGHAQLLSDIVMLETLSAADHSVEARSLLASLTQDHEVMRAAYAAQGASGN